MDLWKHIFTLWNIIWKQKWSFISLQICTVMTHTVIGQHRWNMFMLLKGGEEPWWTWLEERQIVFANTHHHLVLGHPAVGGEILQHRHQELQAPVPVTEQQHHSNQVDDSHHCAGQVIGHMKNLSRDRSRDSTCWTQAVTLCSIWTTLTFETGQSVSEYLTIWHIWNREMLL